MSRVVFVALVVAAAVLRIAWPEERACRLCESNARRAAVREPSAVLGPITGFVENRGQWSDDVRFGAAADGVLAAIGGGAIALRGAGDGGAVRLCFEDADVEAPLEGVSPSGAVCHFLLGADPARHVRDVPVFAAVVQRAVYPGVDLRVRRAGSSLEYDLLLAPHAEPDRVVCRVDGVDRVEVDPVDGALCALRGAAVVLRQPRPVAFEVGRDGSERAVGCDFVVLGARHFGFRVAARGEGAELVIDPPLQWSTFLGASRLDDGYAIATTPDGGVIAAGSTLSPDFPTTTGAFDTTYNGSITRPRTIGDLCIARFSATGALEFATFVGGAENELMEEVHTSADGDVFVSGWTTSSDFPTTPGSVDPTFNGAGAGYDHWGGDVYVTRLSADGARLVYSTFLGGSDLEYTQSMHVQPDGTATVAGHVHSFDFPTTPGAYSRSFRGHSDAFVARLDPSGSTLLFSTYFGGGVGEEYPLAMMVDAQGGTLIGGPTDNLDLPVTPGAYDATFNGGTILFADCFLARLDPSGAAVTLCTYLGGPQDEHVRAICVRRDGTIVVTGETSGQGFPTTAGAFDTSYNGGDGDAFVACFSPDGTRLLWSTFVGGLDHDIGMAVAEIGSGRVVVGGHTRSPDFPTTPGAWSRVHRGFADSMLCELDADGTRVDHATLLGGSFDDRLIGMALHRSGDAVVTGTSYSGDFPTTAGAWDRVNDGGGDIFVARLSLLPNGVERYGAGSPGCAGAPHAGALSQPVRASADFALSCLRANAGSSGALLLGSAALAVPVRVLGVDLWVDPARVVVGLSALADARGRGVVPLPIPDDARLVGVRLFGQFAWPDACAALGLSASSGVAVTIQP